MEEFSFTRRAPAFHGYAPESGRDDAFVPPLSVTISKETGSRGRAIARKTAELLGWDLVSQEVLEYSTVSPSFSTGFRESLTTAAESWVEGQLARIAEQSAITSSEQECYLRSMFEIAAMGNHVILGQSVHLLIPRYSTLAVRLIAPQRDRVAYIAEVERMSSVDAQRFVHEHDQADLDQAELWRSTTTQPAFDVVLNTVQFGIEGCANIIHSAARERQDYLSQEF